MNIRTPAKIIAHTAVLATLLVAGTAFAQSNPVTITSSQAASTTPMSGATNAAIATLTVSSTGSNQISSIPVTFAAGSGSVSDLTNCRLYDNATGQSIGTLSNSNSTTLQNGTNTFILNPVFSVTTVGATLSIRCNIASSATSTASYQFTAGIPVLSGVTSTSATTSTSVTSITSGTGALAVGFSVAPQVVPGNTNVIATISLDASKSGSSVRVPSIQIGATGLGVDNLSACSIRNINALDVSLNSGPNAMSNFGTQYNNVTFDTPLTIPAGGMTTLALICNVQTGAPLSSTFTVSINPAGISAFDTSGATIMPTVAIGSSGAALPTSGVASFSTSGNATGTTTIPGVPNTGAGGDSAETLLLLIVSGLAALFFGLMFISRVRQK